MHDHTTVRCPACGHPLSMFTEPRETAQERVASRIADLFGSWRFLVVLLAATAAWLVVTMAWRPLRPHPTAMLDLLGLALGVLASVQLPLVLLSQRREMERNRDRGREALHIAANNEADLHAIRQLLAERQQHPAEPAPPRPGAAPGAADHR